MTGRARGIKEQRLHPLDDHGLVSELGIRLRRERIRRDDQSADIAGRFSISATTYQRWENGTAVPDFRHYTAVADYLGETIEEVWRLAAGEPFTTTGKLKAELSALARLLGDQARTIKDLRAELAQTRSHPRHG